MENALSAAPVDRLVGRLPKFSRPPESVTKDDLARWFETLKEFVADQKNRHLVWAVEGEKGFERWAAGEWLGERLIALGASEEEMHSVCFANGQRMAGACRYVWATTEETLRQWIGGQSDVPGPELAETICSAV